MSAITGKKRKRMKSIEYQLDSGTFNHSLLEYAKKEKIREIIRHYRESPIRDERLSITTPL